MSSTANRIVKNTGFLYARMAISLFISLWTTRLVLNALGTTDFGIFGIVGGAIAMLGFLNNSMASATQRFMSFTIGSSDKLQQCRVFTNSILIHCGIGFILIFFLEALSYPLFHSILNIPDERIYAAQVIFQFLVISTFLTILSVPYDAAINAHENMGYYAVVGIFESVIKLGIALFVVYTLVDKLIIYGLLMTLLALVMLLIKYIYCRYKYAECRLQIQRYYHQATIKELTSFAGWNVIESMGSMIGNHGSDIVLNHFFGPSINAAGSVGSQLRGQMMAFSNSMLKALTPAIVKSEGQGDRLSMLKFAITGAKMSYLLFALLALPFIVEAPYILRIWLKLVPEWTICFSRFQMLTGLGEQITITLGTALAATGVIRNYSVFSGIAHVAPLLLYVVLYSMGAQPFWTYLITFINFVVIIRFFLLVQCQKYCGLNISRYIRNVALPIIIGSSISFFIGLAVSLSLEETLTRLITVIIVVDLSFIAFSYMWLFDENEKGYMHVTIKNILKLRRHKER